MTSKPNDPLSQWTEWQKQAFQPVAALMEWQKAFQSVAEQMTGWQRATRPPTPYKQSHSCTRGELCVSQHHASSKKSAMRNPAQRTTEMSAEEIVSETSEVVERPWPDIGALAQASRQWEGQLFGGRSLETEV